MKQFLVPLLLLIASTPSFAQPVSSNFRLEIHNFNTAGHVGLTSTNFTSFVNVGELSSSDQSICHELNAGFTYAAFNDIVLTSTSPPLSSSSFSAESLNGGKILLSWEPSPSSGIDAYKIYWDSGTGTVDYTSAIAVLPSTDTAFTTEVLTSSAAYKFSLRSRICRIEDPSTAVLAAASSTNTISEVRAKIIVPQTGKKISGNRITIKAKITGGTVAQTMQVLFQYKASTESVWVDIVAANINHTNPDLSAPFFIHWNASALPSTNYDIRAVATNLQNEIDQAPPSVTVIVDSVDVDIREMSLGGGRIRKTQKIFNTISNTFESADESSSQLTRLVIPAGSLDTSSITISVVNNPAIAPAAPQDVISAGVITEITLSNGQTNLMSNKTASIALAFPDENNDGIVDGALVRGDLLKIYSSDTSTGPWVRGGQVTVDLSEKTVTGTTSHFSFFALFAPAGADLSAVRVYPNPFMPNSGNADDGLPFSSGDPNSGIIFDNLPVSVKIKIYTITGQLVDSISSDNSSGSLRWDVKNISGQHVASGGYFAAITSPGHTRIVKVFIVHKRRFNSFNVSESCRIIKKGIGIRRECCVCSPQTHGSCVSV